MPAYHYRAINRQGRIARGQIAAANESELAQYLGVAGLELINARAKKETARHVEIHKRIKSNALPVFCTQMADLLKAGVAFVDALHDVAETTEPGPMRDTLMDITRNINHGSHIALAFARYPRLFSPVFTAILSAGETSGDLMRTFDRLTRYAETRARTKEQMRRALRYPLFLLFVALSTVAFMMTMVVPQIIQFLNSIDSQLPIMTRSLIAVSDMFASGWWMIGLFVGLSVSALIALHHNSERAAYMIDGALLRVSFTGTMLRKVALARFLHSFAILHESNIGIVASLRGAKATLNNSVMEKRLENAESQIISGQSLSAALDGFLPPFALRMIRIGERSGALGKNLTGIADIQEREVNALTERLIGSLEPTLTLVIGSLLAWIVLAVLGPIYQNLGKLSGMG